MHDASRIHSRITIRLIPSPDEDDDMQTLSLVQGARRDVLDTLPASDAYAVEITGTHTRDTCLIVLIPDVVNGIIAQKDLIMQLFQISKVAIDALAQRGHVTSIEMTIDGDSIRIEGAKETQADRLISIFEAQHPGTLQQIPPPSTIEITGTISKTDEPAIAERFSDKHK